MKKLIFIFLLFFPFLAFSNLQYCDNGRNISWEFCSSWVIITDIKSIDTFSWNYLNIFSWFWWTKLNNDLISDYNSSFQVWYIWNNFNNNLNSENNSNFQVWFLWTNFKQINFWKINVYQKKKEPYQKLDELEFWEAIWKQQMWSGIIFSYSFDNKEKYNVLMIVNIYDSKTDELIKKVYTDYSIWNTNFVKVKDLEPWEYYWTAQLQTWDWIKSKIIKPTEDDSIKTYFKIFDWFEPYANWYRFMNNGPNSIILNWWVETQVEILEENKRNIVKVNRKIIPWNKWNIFNTVFDISDERRKIDSFIWIWLTWTWAFQLWNCFWMSITALAKYRWEEDFLNKYAKWLNDNIWTWTIWEKISDPNTKPTNVVYKKNSWDIYNDNLKWILTLQLYQYWKDIKKLLQVFYKKKNNWINVVERFKNNPNKNYILFVGWKKTEDWEEWWHALIPYRLEKENNYYKLYVWDNNYPYPNVIEKIDWKDTNFKAYEQYIQIFNDGSWYYDWVKNFWNIYTIIWLIDIDNLVNLPKQTKVVWSDEKEIKYWLAWESNIYLEDENGNITWYKDWKVLEQISWVEIYKEIWLLKWQEIKNTYKQIYIPDITKLDISKLKVKVQSTKDEIYNFNITSKDFFAYFQNVETNSWDLDEFKITRENIQIDFDENKTWDYDLLVDNFKDNWTWTVFLSQVKTIDNLHSYYIDWDKVINNKKWAITYHLDIDNNWSLDKNLEITRFWDNASLVFQKAEPEIQAPRKSSGWWWKSKDRCKNWDYSWNQYDWKCWVKPNRDKQENKKIIQEINTKTKKTQKQIKHKLKINQREIIYTLKTEKVCKKINTIKKILQALETKKPKLSRYSKLNDLDKIKLKNEVISFELVWIITWDKDKNFNPQNPITRAEFLWVLLDSHCYDFKNIDLSKIKFKDVDLKSWQAKVVAKALELWLINWYADNTFRPNNIITKAEALWILYNLRISDIEKWKLNKHNYKDIKVDWENKLVINLETLGIINPKEDNKIFNPNQWINRETMINYIIKVIKFY